MPTEGHGKRAVAVREEFGWAVEIVRRHFSTGLERLCEPKFLTKRYEEFLRKDDPIYVELLKGMEDEPLSKTFVSYWTIAHTLATESRFWLECAVAEIILHQVRKFGRLATHVLTQSMLSDGYLERKVTVADLGEIRLEHVTSRKPWRPPIQRSVLRTIDTLVGEEERQAAHERDPLRPRQWQNRLTDEEAKKRDQQHLKKVATSFRGPPSEQVNLHCNLLVVEPDPLDGKVHAWCFRFVNPKTISQHAARKQERVNMFRVYALLVQEKILRDPRCIQVNVAELLPRYSQFSAKDRYPDYFSSATYWTSDRLWEFIGVPFEVVTAAIQDVAKEFRRRLIEGLRDLLPKRKSVADGAPRGLQNLSRWRSRQPTLFDLPTAPMKSFTNTHDYGDTEIEGWMAAGWLSFDPRPKDVLTGPEKAELDFVSALGRSGLSYESLCRAFAQLDKPYAYDTDGALWDFGRRCWRDNPEEIGDAIAARLEALDESDFQSWIDLLVLEEDWDTLRSLVEYLPDLDP